MSACVGQSGVHDKSLLHFDFPVHLFLYNALPRPHNKTAVIHSSLTYAKYFMYTVPLNSQNSSMT